MRLQGLLLVFVILGVGSNASPSVSGRGRAAGDPSAESDAYHANAGVLRHVNPLIGTQGSSPEDNGGMIPSVAPPFGMTRWVAQTRENYISQVSYSSLDDRIHGFQATHQPAIWMGENGHVTLMPGLGDQVQPLFQKRGLTFRRRDERSTAYVYQVELDADSAGGEHGWNLTEEAAVEAYGDGCPPCPGGAAAVPDSVSEGAGGRVRRRGLETSRQKQKMPSDDRLRRYESRSLPQPQQASNDTYKRSIRVAMSATSHVGHLRVDFDERDGRTQPHLIIQATRFNWTGLVAIDAAAGEVWGSNPQRHDYDLGPDRPESFRMYFVSRFSEPFASFGTTTAGELHVGQTRVDGKFVGAYVSFDRMVRRVEVRTGVSYVSVDQARRNLDVEVPDGRTFEETVDIVKAAWLEKLGRVSIEGTNSTDEEHDPLAVFYTGLFHSLQYPSDFSEPTERVTGGRRVFYSGYTDSVHSESDSYYQLWSLWDTYRAQHPLLTLFAPERVDSMMRSLLRIFDWTGRLPIWANMVETNIMIATNANAVLANALVRGFRGFNASKAWEAVRRDAYEPPERDTELLFFDREPFTPREARAGLTSYLSRGWVDNDYWSEAGSRTLDYAFNDYACAIVAAHAGQPGEYVDDLLARSRNYDRLWNAERQSMQTRNRNGSFARPTWGWAEGDDWVYTFDVMHDVDGMAALFRGGREGLKAKLDEHFAGGHNMHSNEPSHHVPYLYSALGYVSDTAREVRRIAWANYNATANGLSGNEDLGQMSAWFVLSALGFYPLNPASDEYIVGSPLFDRVEIAWPGNSEGRTLVISAPGAGTKGKAYVRGLRIDGERVDGPVLRHARIVAASTMEFDMSDEPTQWGMSS